MDKFGSLFASPFTPGDGEVQNAEDRTYHDDFNNMRMDIPNYGREGMPDSFNNMRMDYNGPDIMPEGPVVPPQFDMPSPAVLPGAQPGFGMPPPQQGGGFLSPVVNDWARQLPGMLAGMFGGLKNQQNPGARPMPQPMPMRQPGFMPNTRAPGGGGMDYNGNPIGGGMGAQFNFAGPRTGMAQPMPMPQRRMPAPMRPAAGPVRPASSITRTRRR